jgi:predicted RND superfamily exporter protein
LGLPQAITLERLEAIATKLDQSDLIYWSAKAKRQREVIQKKGITVSSEATGYTNKRITKLEEDLERSQARVKELEEIVEVAKEVIENMIPSKSNMIRGNALVKLRDKLKI